jgi:hypothetical protein
VNPAAYPGVRAVPTGVAVNLGGDEDKPPFFLPNRAAYRAAAKPVKTRLRKATKWAWRTRGNPELRHLFGSLADRALDDLDFLREARS